MVGQQFLIKNLTLKMYVTYGDEQFRHCFCKYLLLYELITFLISKSHPTVTSGEHISLQICSGQGKHLMTGIPQKMS